jgi:hypothetical protein
MAICELYLVSMKAVFDCQFLKLRAAESKQPVNTRAEAFQALAPPEQLAYS